MEGGRVPVAEGDVIETVTGGGIWGDGMLGGGAEVRQVEGAMGEGDADEVGRGARGDPGEGIGGTPWQFRGQG